MNLKHSSSYSIDRVLKDLSSGLQIKKLLILDMGCGEGNKTGLFARNGFKVIALDKSREIIKKTSNSLSYNNVRFVIGDMAKIEFKPRSFDLIIAVSSLNFLAKPNAKKIISKMKEWTKFNGYNIISVFRKDVNLSDKKSLYLFDDGELKESYFDWRIECYREPIFIDKKHGKPHTHKTAMLVASKPVDNEMMKKMN